MLFTKKLNCCSALGLLLVSLFVNSHIFAQEEIKNCGTIVPSEMEALERISPGTPQIDLSSGRSGAALDSFPMRYIPFTIYMVGKDDSTGYFDVEKGLEVMCDVNKAYESLGMQFYLFKDPAKKALKLDYTFNKTETYEGKDNAIGTGFSEGKYVFNAFNIYRTQSLNEGQAAGYATFPTGNVYQGGAAVADDDISTWAHEFGHFFNLYHTFQGSEIVFRCSTIVNNDTIYHADCDTLAKTCLGNDTLVKPNCNAGGDYICDTQASPDLTGMVGSYPTCKYFGNGTDMLCWKYTPDTRNWMDYIFAAGCPSRFSKGQVQRVRNCIDGHPTQWYSRSYLWENNPIPKKVDTLVSAVHVAPQDTIKVMDGSEVLFSWEPVTDAEGYFIRIYQKMTTTYFILKERVYVTNPNYVSKLAFKDSSNYAFSVRPIHANNFCNSAYSEKTVFHVQTIPTGIDETNYKVSLDFVPNPVKQNEGLRVIASVYKPEQSNLQILDIAGKTVLSIPYTFRNGENVLNVPTATLNPGLYFLTLRSSGQVVNKKLVIF